MPYQSAKLKLEQLEARDVPALWAVHLATPGSGMPGDSAATFSGGFAIDTLLPTNANGDTLVEADSQTAALAQALVGTVTAHAGSESLSYGLTSTTIGTSTAEHRPFVFGNGSLWLEDLAYSAGGSDWDYNDRVWMISVTPEPGGSSQSYGYPTMVWITGGAGTYETSASNGWFVVHRNDTAGELTVNFGVVASNASDTATLDLDYNILGNGTSVTFDAGAGEAMIYIHPMIDALHSYEEPFEAPIELVTLALSAGTGYTVYTPNQAFIQLGNVDLLFDLDVNHNGSLADVGIDLAKNYLPGYEAGAAKVSTGTSFNVPAYEGQWMKLVINGIGTASVDHVTRVEFIIAQVSADPGYTGNRTDPSLEGLGKTEDYSFRRNGREGADLGVASKITIERDVNTSNANLYGGAYGGNMEATSTWVNFWCKDYGGAARLRADVYIRNENGIGERLMPDPFGRLALSVPLDDDQDGIADKWEIAMGARWSAQYGTAALTDMEAKQKFNNFDDLEEMDPDKAGTTAQGPLREQAETGDAHSVKEEYRGYILNGGSGGFAGGYIRLDPARKEILVEVDRAAVLDNVPGAGNDTNVKLKTILNGASGVFSNAERGAGIYMYWLMDDMEQNIALVDANTKVKQMTRLSDARNSTLASDFIHVLLIDSGCLEAFEGNAIAYSRIDTNDLTRRGVVFATSDTTVTYKVADYPKREELFSSVLAHELTHMIIPDFTVSAGFDDNEHMFAPQADNTELMFIPRSKANREFATVKIGPLAQKVFKIRSSEGISN